MVKTFGIWEINSSGINCKIGSGYTYRIDKKTLWDTIDRDGFTLNVWPIHLSDNSWMTDKILDDLFDALEFAQQYFLKNNTKTKDFSWGQTKAYAKENLNRN